MTQLNLFKTAYVFISLILMLVSCASAPARSVPKDTSIYTTKTPDPDGIGKVFKGREIAHVMGTAGAEWLERDTRQQEEAVDQAIALMLLRPNSAVADIGTGTGYYSFRIAPKIKSGTLYAVDVQDEFVNALQEKSRQLHLKNVTVVKGSVTTPNLPDSSIDLAFMVDVYHELEYPYEMLQALYKALKPDGRLLLIEYRAEDPSIPIKALHKLSVAQANKELQTAGFVLDKDDESLPIQHFLLYKKAPR